jgi:regulator of cell morphogenesis and NO signaling
MNLDRNIPVAGLAVKVPEAIRVFENFGIDYCCGGEQSLEQACKVRHTDVQGVISAIQQAMEGARRPSESASASQSELVDHIVNSHHQFTRTEIERLSALLQKVIAAHGTRHPELLLVQKVFKDLAHDLTPHLWKEERVLFPYILALDSSFNSRTRPATPPFVTLQNPLRMMSFEHDLAGQLLRELRRSTTDYTVPADACSSYKALYDALKHFEADLHQHIHLENNLLFPRAMDMENKCLRSGQTP